jgi:glycosyltransferase involved in cell wall biosynthesis
VRVDHSDRWGNLQESRINEFQAYLKSKYPNLYQGDFPSLTEFVDYDLTSVNLDSHTFNRLEKNQLHLLIIMPWLVMGGTERFILSMMDQLIERGWMITIASTAQSDHPWLSEFEKRSSDIFILPNFLPLKEYPNFLSYLVGSRGIDTVMVQGSLEGYRFIPALRAACPEVPIVDFLHFVTPDWMEGGFPKLSLLYKDFIDLTFTSCYQVRDWMLAQGSNTDKIEVCYIGVDPQIWKPDFTARRQVRSDLGIGMDETVIVYAARLEAQKQPDVFIKSLARLKEKGDKFQALVAGEGSLLAQLKAAIQTYGLRGRVHLLGAVPAPKMPAVMAAADIFFLPSKNEGISQALYEAMSCGLVVVCARVGGQAEVVIQDCGFLYTPGTQPDEVTQYAEYLHALVCDGPHREKMSHASRERIVENFSISLMGECVHRNLLNLIVNQKSSPETATPTPDLSSVERETRNAVEYLQVRQRQRWLEREYSALVTPKPPSHWFYLWIRQIFLPLYTRMRGDGSSSRMEKLIRSIKRRFVKTS